MKILVLALSGIGDGLMFTPALSLLKQAEPKAEIDVLVMFKGCGDVFQNNPNLNNVIYFDFMKEGALSSLKFLLKIRGKYDISINVYPSNRLEYNVINYIIGAKQRCGIDYLRNNGKNLSFLNNIRCTEDDNLHNVIENVRVIEKLTNKKFLTIPKLDFFLTEEDGKFAEDYINQNNIDSNIVIGVHPGCNTLKNHINRRWDPKNFSLLAQKLSDKYNCKILVFGGPEEADIKKTVVGNNNLKNIKSVETKSLTETLAVMKHCNYFISNDSSLMHVSSALGLHVFPIIGPTNMNYIHPWQTSFTEISLKLECSPCFYYSPKPLNCSRLDKKYKCIKDISVEYAYDVITKKIDEDLGKQCVR